MLPHCQNGHVAKAEGKKSKHWVDPTWPKLPEGEHAVSELASTVAGGLSPFGDVEFPLPAEDLPYIHPTTVINR